MEMQQTTLLWNPWKDLIERFEQGVMAVTYDGFGLIACPLQTSQIFKVAFRPFSPIKTVGQN